MNLESVMLNDAKKVDTEVIYYMIPFTGNIQNRREGNCRAIV
jgi:hypothetical protein